MTVMLQANLVCCSWVRAWMFVDSIICEITSFTITIIKFVTIFLG